MPNAAPDTLPKTALPPVAPSGKPRVGILTTFYEFNSSYSLCSVVESQLVSLVEHGYSPVLFVHDNFDAYEESKVPAGVEVRRVVPRFTLVDYSANQAVTADFTEQIRTAYDALKANAQDIDVMIEHDLIFQGWFLPYCVAIHQFAERYPRTRWLHWTHSVPSTRPEGVQYPHALRYTLPRHSKLVYLNHYGIVRAAEAYGLFPKDVRIVHNPVDPRLTTTMPGFVRTLVERYGLLEADFVQTYPVSTPRMVDGKQVKVVIEVFAALKRLGRSVRLVVPNAHANDKREQQVVAEVLSFANEQGLNRSEVVFTSLESPPLHEHGIVRECVSGLMALSNLFVFPSVSENCPLILLEAMQARQILVLNDNVGSMRELAGDAALYFEFGSNHTKVDYADRKRYMDDVAKIIVAEYESNRPLKASNRLKQKFNYDTIFKTQLEPLLYETF